MGAIEILRDLVEIDSISCNSNKKLLDYLSDFLKEYGFEIMIQKIDDKFNLIAYNKESNPKLIFSGHMDTVPGKNWKKEPLILNIIDGRCYGLGSVDMKGPIACMLESIKKNKPKNLALIFTFNEEVDFSGVNNIVKNEIFQKFKNKNIIVGEPTMFVPINTHKGSINIELTVQGKEGHASEPEKGINSIVNALALINEFKKFELEHKKKNPNLIDYPTFNIGTISGGSASNIIPGECSLKINIRVPPKMKNKEIIQEIDNIIKKLGEKIPNFSSDYKIIKSTEPFKTEDCEFTKKIESILDIKCSGVAYCTEGSIFNEHGSKTIILGPGSIDRAHKPEEYIEIKELEQGVEMYSKILNTIAKNRFKI